MPLLYCVASVSPPVKWDPARAVTRAEVGEGAQQTVRPCGVVSLGFLLSGAPHGPWGGSVQTQSGSSFIIQAPGHPGARHAGYWHPL